MAPVRLIAGLSVLASVLLAPPVYGAVFALSALFAAEARALWLVAVVFAAVGLALARTPSPRLAALWLSVLFFVFAELGLRLLGHAAGHEVASRWAALSDRTFAEGAAIAGHPFLQYVPTEGVNNLGFVGQRDYVRAKPPGVVRIAVLGGSTSAGINWPNDLEKILNERLGGRPTIEVMTFAQPGYSTAHLVVTFFLNVLDYDVDFVIVHAGWNDTVFRDPRVAPRTDFSNVFKVFEFPRPRDRWLMRTSVVYRLAYDHWVGTPQWAELRPAIAHGWNDSASFAETSTLETTRKNFEKILAMAARRGIRPVLATLPYSTRDDVPNAREADHLRQVNDLVRGLADEHRSNERSAILVDLDRAMTGTANAHFGDLAHLDPAGRRMKASLVADALFPLLEESTGDRVTVR